MVGEVAEAVVEAVVEEVGLTCRKELEEAHHPMKNLKRIGDT